MSVNMFDDAVDMSSLASADPVAAAEVKSFATDVSSSFAASVSASLGLSADTVEVACLYRNSDVTKLDLLTLAGSCGSSRILKALFLRERRLQAEGFGVEIEILGDDAVQSATKSEGTGNVQSPTEMLAAQIASTDVVIESDLLPQGVKLDAALGEIKVEVATQAPTPMPTADPTASPTPGPTAKPTAAPTPAPTLSAALEEKKKEKKAVPEEKATPKPDEKATPKPRARSSSSTAMTGSMTASSGGAMIVGAILAASLAVIALGAGIFQNNLKKNAKPVEVDHEGNVNALTEVVDPEAVRITVPEPHSGTAESAQSDHEIRKLFTELDL
jgi:hypothetical protein